MAIEKVCTVCGAYYVGKECEECLNQDELEKQHWAHHQDQDEGWIASQVGSESRRMDVMLNTLQILD